MLAAICFPSVLYGFIYNTIALTDELQNTLANIFHTLTECSVGRCISSVQTNCPQLNGIKVSKIKLHRSRRSFDRGFGGQACLEIAIMFGSHRSCKPHVKLKSATHLIQCRRVNHHITITPSSNPPRHRQ